MPHPTQMSFADTGLLVIDVQDRLMPKIINQQSIVHNIGFLIDAARLLNMPVVATEQYPKGLGPTVPELAAKLPDRPNKVDFSCCAIPAVVDTFRREARPKVLLAGIEAHVCVQPLPWICWPTISAFTSPSMPWVAATPSTRNTPCAAWKARELS